jgi:hypothetical protein
MTHTAIIGYLHRQVNIKADGAGKKGLDLFNAGGKIVNNPGPKLKYP